MVAVTRRAVLGAGAATLGLLVLGTEASSAPNAAAAPPRRSDYARSAGKTFTASAAGRSHRVRLAQIRDVAGAPANAGDDSFNLIFTGPDRVPEGIYTLRRPGVPAHNLFLSRIGDGATLQALVNRTV